MNDYKSDLDKLIDIRAIDESIARRKREQAEFTCTVFRACLVGALMIIIAYTVWRVMTSDERERAAYLAGWSEEVS